NVSRLLASFLLLDHLDDLFVRESRLHLSVLRLGGLYTKMEKIQGLRSNSLMFSAVAHDCFALGLTQHL
ncbi:hypothetical protein, partial [Pseudophaeobacter sp.]|uniref:hypothetical protein n=1 Tax=Pseudophaeobacter sp. TaxID=1971739 RepID=UPI003292DEB1